MSTRIVRVLLAVLVSLALAGCGILQSPRSVMSSVPHAILTAA